MSLHFDRVQVMKLFGPAPVNNIEKVQGLYAAYGRGDIQHVLDMLDDNVSWGIESVAAGSRTPASSTGPFRPASSSAGAATKTPPPPATPSVRSSCTVRVARSGDLAVDLRSVGGRREHAQAPTHVSAG